LLEGTKQFTSPVTQENDLLKSTEINPLKKKYIVFKDPGRTAQ